jgi:hypothetical protein
MKKRFYFYFIAVLVILAAPLAFAGDGVPIDVLYMDHGPMQPTLRELRALFQKYGDKIKVSWYDFESTAGEQFKAEKGLSRHTPLMIWVDGRSKLAHNGRTLKLEGFPTGAGPAFFQGKWELADLAAILDQVTGSN